MTQIPPSKSSSSPTKGSSSQEPALAPEVETSPEVQSASGRSYAPMFAKGCGLLLLCIVLGAGVAVVGKGEIASLGSAIVGVLFLVLILGSSGLTGWWHK
jgi:hypothetical protein